MRRPSHRPCRAQSTALVKHSSPECSSGLVIALISKREQTILIGALIITEFYAVVALKGREGEWTRDDWYAVLTTCEAEAARDLSHVATPTSETSTATKGFLLDYPTLRPSQVLHLRLGQEFRSLRLVSVSTDRQIFEPCLPLDLYPINPEEASGQGQGGSLEPKRTAPSFLGNR